MKRLWYRLRNHLRIAWEWMTGWIPTRVWVVDGPLGDGPWFDNCMDAAMFIVENTTEDEELKPWERPLRFSWHMVKHLWKPGRKVEYKDWSIACITVPRRRLEDEWNGW